MKWRKLTMEKEELLTKIKAENKKQALEKVSLTEEEAQLNKECIEAATSSNVLEDKDIVLGQQELDIRNLSKENKEQLFFRLLAVQTSQTRQLTQIVIDLERLLMLLLTKNGLPAEEIANAINELINKLTEESQKNIKEMQKAA